MKKKIISLGYALIIAFSVICSSYLTSYDVQAAGLVTSIRDKLAYYVLTTTGALNAGVNGVTQATSSAISAVQEKIAELWGNGIYEDASGNYVFSGTASKELLETIMGQTNLNARVISSFPGVTPYGGSICSDSAYCHPQVKSFLNTGRSLYTDYLCLGGLAQNSNWYYSNVIFCDLSNVAYIHVYIATGITLRFMNDQGQNIPVNVSYASGAYVNGNFRDYSSGSSTAGSVDIYNGYGNSQTRVGNNLYFNNFNNLILDNDFAFNYFPYIADNLAICWSNKSIIVCKESAYGLQEANRQSGTFVSNTYNEVNVIPTVSKTVIENNNWQKIYNDYVTNVNNESNTYITNETLDPTALRKVMKKYTKVITDAIDQGVTDIENAISTTNEWLKKIYERLGEISSKIDNLEGGSGGGSGGECSWTSEDIATITAAISRIDSNLASELTEMQRTYTLLGQILSAINNIEVDGGDSITNIIPILVNLPDSDVLDFIDTGDVLADLMSSVVPFCFVGFALGLCNTLDSQPVTPRWVIPLRLNSATTGLNVNEEMVIDFADYEESGFGFIHDLLIAAQCILFIIALIWLTFNLLESFNLIFG